jgi:alkylation response protein AidB-like acyl-CoA dehydrogenase
MLNARRTMLVASQVGAMQAIHEHCIAELGETVRYGQPLTELQGVQAALGRQYVSIESSRALLYRALARLAGYEGRIDPLFDPVVSAAKHFVTEQALSLATSALRLLGARGYVRGRVERFMRDSLGLLAGGGTQDCLEIDLGTRAIAEAQREKEKP